jgi:hypothetical protein
LRPSQCRFPIEVYPRLAVTAKRPHLQRLGQPTNRIRLKRRRPSTGGAVADFDERGEGMGIPRQFGMRLRAENEEVMAFIRLSRARRQQQRPYRQRQQQEPAVSASSEHHFGPPVTTKINVPLNYSPHSAGRGGKPRGRAMLPPSLVRLVRLSRNTPSTPTTRHIRWRLGAGNFASSH